MIVSSQCAAWASSSPSGPQTLLPPHVDVQVYLRKGGNIPDTITKTFLEDVRVFAINQTTSREQDEEGNKINAKTVSLLLKPAQVEEMLLASRLGQISLSLRRPDDESTDDTQSQGTRISSLLRGQAVDGTPEGGAKPNVPQTVPATSKNAAADFTSWLNSVTADGAKEPASNDSAVQLASAYWTVQILTPAGVTNFEVANNDSISAARQLSDEPSAGQLPPSANVPASTTDFDDAPLHEEPASTDADAGHDDDASHASGDDSAAGDDSTTDSASGEEAGLDS
jgi:pilus assembly protein CpaB